MKNFWKKKNIRIGGMSIMTVAAAFRALLLKYFAGRCMGSLFGDTDNQLVLCPVGFLAGMLTCCRMPVIGIIGGPLGTERVDVFLFSGLLLAGAQSKDQRQKEE